MPWSHFLAFFLSTTTGGNFQFSPHLTSPSDYWRVSSLFPTFARAIFAALTFLFGFTFRPLCFVFQRRLLHNLILLIWTNLCSKTSAFWPLFDHILCAHGHYFLILLFLLYLCCFSKLRFFRAVTQNFRHGAAAENVRSQILIIRVSSSSATKLSANTQILKVIIFKVPNLRGKEEKGKFAREAKKK